MEINEDIIRILILVFIYAEFIWERYLDFRQFKVYKTNNTIPNDLKEFITEESFGKARAYGIDKSVFRQVKEMFSICMVTLYICNDWFYLGWEKSEQLAQFIGMSPDNEIVVTCIFMIIFTILSNILNTPFYVYSTFVLEEKHGFNNTTVGFYIKDQIKSILLYLIITLPIISSIIFIINIGGSMFVFWLWLFTTLVTLLLVTIFPTVIAPLFDKFTPLPDGALRTSIEDLAKKLKFPLTQIYIVEGSARSAHSNAYFTGLFGGKRIVLFDTLLEKFDEDKNIITGCKGTEILGVLAHELGHWSCGHINKNILLTEVNLLLVFIGFGALFKYSSLYMALGFPPGLQPVIIGFIVITRFILTPYNSILSYFGTLLSRKHEYEADNFAISLNFADELRMALIKLGKDNLDFPIYDKIYSSWYHSHPTLLHRIENIDNYMNNKKID